ncbi:MAG: PDZ domain-containing protein, partial [Bacteroidia bacterium]|nr:PDZ domain-containing protein [Bacteroidia bacterium]
MKSIFLTIILLAPFTLPGQIDAKLIQFPDVSDTQICFTFGDDLWIVSKSGGDATKLSSPAGRETNPKFSPDGQSIAFEANYDGNNDIYTIPVRGGVPQRVTGHGMTESIMDWHPGGNKILFGSSSESGKQRWSQFYLVNKDGGLPEKLPVELGANAALSVDGNQLAFTDKSRIYRTWKRYRGGTAPDIHVMNLKTLECENITNNDANDEKPMWHNSMIYYMSDNGPAMRNNIWVYNPADKSNTQLTFFKDYDIHHPSIGPADIVFEAGGKIHLMNLDDHSTKEVKINAVGDFTSVRPALKKVNRNIFSYHVSPDGMRAVMEARGDIFTLPRKKGVVRNITKTSGVAERFPAWSPDGKSIAYFSDASGEYELTIHNLKTGDNKQVSNLGPGFRYRIFWSPDSKKVAFIDQTMTFWELEIESGSLSKIDQESTLFEGGLRSFTMSYSTDSRWIAYVKAGDNKNSAVFLYDSNTKISTQVTSGFYNDNQVYFGPNGDHLFVSTNRGISPVYSDFDNTWIYPNATQLAVVPLRKDVDSPFLPENDDVELEDEDESENEDDDNESDDDEDDNEDGDDDDDDDDDEVDPVEIDLEGFERRMQVLPVKVGNMYNISASGKKVIYIKVPNSGSEGEKNTLKYYDLEEEEEKTIMADVNNYVLSSNGEKMLVSVNGDFGIIEVGADKKLEDKLATSEMTSMVDPREEWKQIFNDVWRLERDYFYDKDLHGVDWNAMKSRYGQMIDQAMSRSDVNYIIGELIGELNASHTYRGGGDSESASRKNVGYLGVDWEKINGEFRIKTILKGADWDLSSRSPLEMPGVNINEGDYILEVNGLPLNQYNDPWIPFTGMANKTVELTVNDKPSLENARKELVKTMRSETRLRNLAWIESNRKMVDDLSGGKIGYIYVPSTGIDGQNELIRMFYGQWHKEGLIIDERFNNGGQIPDRFIELLNRKPLAFWDVRDGGDWQWPPVAHFGPKAMLINGWSGSG